MEKVVTFKNNVGLNLSGAVHEPGIYDTALIYCHGFPSSGDGKSAKRIGETFAKKGYLVLRFSFSGTPPSEGRLEKNY
ncbi:MAG: hypothetical protein AABX53_04285 [Nanoarchaeota archaeon]